MRREPSKGIARLVLARAGFTLIELTIVIALVGVIGGLVTFNLGTFSFWRDEAFIRRLSEVVVFLHHQAVSDQAYYRLNIDLGSGGTNGISQNFWVGVMRTEEEDPLLQACNAEVGQLSCDLAAFLSPSLGKTQTEIPPPNFPSLAEKVFLPEGTRLDDVRTMRGKKLYGEGSGTFVMFSPRGFSEFAVFHLTLSNQTKATILINPFTGTTDIYREYKDFEWTYGRKESRMK